MEGHVFTKTTWKLNYGKAKYLLDWLSCHLSGYRNRIGAQKKGCGTDQVREGTKMKVTRQNP